jgi:hypothetical protein
MRVGHHVQHIKSPLHPGRNDHERTDRLDQQDFDPGPTARLGQASGMIICFISKLNEKNEIKYISHYPSFTGRLSAYEGLDFI